MEAVKKADEDDDEEYQQWVRMFGKERADELLRSKALNTIHLSGKKDEVIINPPLKTRQY